MAPNCFKWGRIINKKNKTKKNILPTGSNLLVDKILSFVLYSSFYHAQAATSGFWSGVDWQLLVNSQFFSPNKLWILYGLCFFFTFLFNFFLFNFIWHIFWGGGAATSMLTIFQNIGQNQTMGVPSKGETHFPSPPLQKMEWTFPPGTQILPNVLLLHVWDLPSLKQWCILPASGSPWENTSDNIHGNMQIQFYISTFLFPNFLLLQHNAA